jgi:hypothetical protein
MKMHAPQKMSVYKEDSPPSYCSSNHQLPRFNINMLFTSVFTATALLVAQAAAHGAVTSYVIDGVTYPGYTGFSPASSPKTIQRQWPDYNPTMTVTDKKVMCNGGTSADLVAKVAAGGKIRANWGQWTHAQGPVMVWMYKCASDIKSCDGSGKKWFKIDQMGMTAPPLSGNSWGNGTSSYYMRCTRKTSTDFEHHSCRHEAIVLGVKGACDSCSGQLPGSS